MQPITDEELTDSQGQQRTRCLVFSVAGNPGAQPTVYIDCKQFDPTVINHSMALNTAEEWTIYNVSGLVHPFHIHINPFMVTNVHDPTKATQSEIDAQPMLWQDTILLPPANTQSTPIEPGSVTIRHRFLDFTGQYVLHCHILGHEDRGMMQVVETVESEELCPPGARWQDKQTCPTCPEQGVPEGVIQRRGRSTSAGMGRRHKRTNGRVNWPMTIMGTHHQQTDYRRPSGFLNKAFGLLRRPRPLEDGQTSNGRPGRSRRQAPRIAFRGILIRLTMVSGTVLDTPHSPQTGAVQSGPR